MLALLIMRLLALKLGSNILLTMSAVVWWKRIGLGRLGKIIGSLRLLMCRASIYETLIRRLRHLSHLINLIDVKLKLLNPLLLLRYLVNLLPVIFAKKLPAFFLIINPFFENPYFTSRIAQFVYNVSQISFQSAVLHC